MAKLEEQNPGGAGLVFAAHNNHPRTAVCLRRSVTSTTRGCITATSKPLRRAVRLRLRPGDEDRYGLRRRPRLGRTQGVHSRAGGRGPPRHPKTCRADRASRKYRDITLADHRRRAGLGRLTGLTGKDEVIWLRECLKACVPDPELGEWTADAQVLMRDRRATQIAGSCQGSRRSRSSQRLASGSSTNSHFAGSQRSRRRFQ